MKKITNYLSLAVFSLCLSGTGMAQMGQHNHGSSPTTKEIQTPSENKVKDPVCGMEITADKAKGKSKYKNKTYYFCSISDKDKFDKEPQKYSGK